jgi:YHS domain-containing protein
MQSMTTASAGRPAACTMSTAVIDGTTYYHCAPNWYQKAYVNGETTYVAVAAPPGY